MPETLTVEVNGKKTKVPNGVTVAAAVYLAGETAFRISVSGEPRGPLCGMGICFECRVTIGARPNCRSCQIAASEGMVIRTSRRTTSNPACYDPTF